MVKYGTILYESKTDLRTIRSGRTFWRIHNSTRWTSFRCSKSKNKGFQYSFSIEVIVSIKLKPYDLFRLVLKIKDKNEKVFSELFTFLCRVLIHRKRESWIKCDLFYYRKRKSHVRVIYNKWEKLDQNIRDAYRSTKRIEPIPKISIRIIPRDIRVIIFHQANK